MLVLDANILIRAVLGSRVLALLLQYEEKVEFVAPAIVFEEARAKLPGILEARKRPAPPAIETLELVAKLVRSIEAHAYSAFEDDARERIERRDEDDWPALATALALGCPIWTEDLDFFGCGVATWTTDRVELYLGRAAAG
ncbi:PIN domain-containing protein [Nostoc sp. NIES-2111]